MFKLRPYQKECVSAVIKKWGEHMKLLMVLPTASGKTIIFSAITKILVDNNKKVLILSHRNELVNQSRDKLKMSTGLDCATEKAGETALGSLFPVTVGSVQTLCRQKRLDQFSPNHYDVIIIDEGHHACSDTYLRIINYFTGARYLLCSATPRRSDKKTLASVVDDIAYEYNIRDGIDQGYLSKVVCQTIPLSIDLAGVKTKMGDYNEADLGDAIEPYLDEVADKMLEHASDRKILVFLPLIRTSKIMTDALNMRGFRACHIDGKSPDRAEILEDFSNDKYNVLTNASLLTEGYDETSIDCIVVLRPTKSTGLYTQMVGRGFRLHEGKENLLILDFLWLSNDHKLVHPSSLIAENEEVAQAITERAAKGGVCDLEELEKEATNQISNERESKLAKYLDACRHRKGRVVDPLAFGALLGNEDITEYDAVFDWQKEKATDKQMEVLQKSGIDCDGITKGYASVILDSIFKRREKNLATPKQCMVLMKYGKRKFDGLTFADASELINKIADNNWVWKFHE